LLLTHGILGAGSNLRTVARKLVEKRTEWGVELVDLRLHGRSEAGEPPHDLEACANDVAALAAELAKAGRPIDALAGHSFGGKVVLAARSRIDVAQTWMLDASPSARPGAIDDPANTVSGVLAMLEALPKTWARRDDFVAAAVRAGQTQMLAQWLAMNVVPAGGELTLRLDLPGVRALLADYYARDLWSALEEPRGEVIVVIAERSSSISADDRARLAGRATVYSVAADHWLHAEAPDALVELFAEKLP
jgi:pimeloyl-ACP methyl ester carboxylesterase